MVALTYCMYNLIKDYLFKILDWDLLSVNNQVALCGGIMINCEGEKTDMFLPLHFELKTKDS